MRSSRGGGWRADGARESELLQRRHWEYGALEVTGPLIEPDAPNLVSSDLVDGHLGATRLHHYDITDVEVHCEPSYSASLTYAKAGSEAKSRTAAHQRAPTLRAAERTETSMNPIPDFYNNVVGARVERG